MTLGMTLREMLRENGLQLLNCPWRESNRLALLSGDSAPAGAVRVDLQERATGCVDDAVCAVSLGVPGFHLKLLRLQLPHDGHCLPSATREMVDKHIRSQFP